jgi:thiamine-monophosphate kinase
VKHTAPLSENIVLRNLTQKFRRSPTQIGGLLESDAELLKLEDGSVLALSTDNIVEEIAVGLYTDPAQIGWMTVMANLSDLAAVGAEPLGILLSQNFPPNYPQDHMEALQSGIAEACEQANVYVLGGDTNTSGTLQMGGTAVGIIKSGPVITRKGIRSGNLLYVSGGMGTGAAYAFETLMGAASTLGFRPRARLKEGQIVRSFGSGCMDTSDGFFPALCNLMEVNEIGFTITRPFSEFIHPDAFMVATKNKMPGWFFLAGPHGEFELMFTIPPENEALFERHAAAINWHPVKIGIATTTESCRIQLPDGTWRLDPCQIANLYEESDGNPRILLSNLIKKQTIWQLP